MSSSTNDLFSIGYAVAGIATHLPTEDAKQVPGGIMRWQRYSKEMHGASKNLIKSFDGKDLAQIKAAAMKLKDSCTHCHDAFR